VKIRNEITLWITCVGVFASLLFSLVVFWEMIEQPYDLLDAELKAAARTMVRLIEEKQKHGEIIPSNTLLVYGTLYWIKVYNSNKDVLYKSDITRLVEIPINNKKSHTVKIYIPKERINLDLDQNSEGEVAFRVRAIKITSKKYSYIIHIAKPIEDLEDEISELLFALLLGLGSSAVLLVLAGYFVAGRILRPISVINSLAREINEKTLGKRIPLGEKHDELYDLASSLNRMFDRLQYSFIRQKEFIASASHELKTPITILRLFMEEAFHQEDLPEPFKQQLFAKTGILFRMEHLVKNLLNLSYLELKDSFEPNDCNLANIIRSVCSDFYEIFLTKKINLEVNLPEKLYIQADKKNIRHMLKNILDNAVKYNHEHGEIKIESVETGDTVTLTLFNTGLGIPLRARSGHCQANCKVTWRNCYYGKQARTLGSDTRQSAKGYG